MNNHSRLKKRGRPPTGAALKVANFRIADEKRGAIERWCSLQPDKPPFAEALRRLIDIGLQAHQVQAMTNDK
jgi:hypothetical protein